MTDKYLFDRCKDCHQYRYCMNDRCSQCNEIKAKNPVPDVVKDLFGVINAKNK